jgi:hypothetical protein
MFWARSSLVDQRRAATGNASKAAVTPARTGYAQMTLLESVQRTKWLALVVPAAMVAIALIGVIVARLSDVDTAPVATLSERVNVTKLQMTTTDCNSIVARVRAVIGSEPVAIFDYTSEQTWIQVVVDPNGVLHLLDQAPSSVEAPVLGHVALSEPILRRVSRAVAAARMLVEGDWSPSDDIVIGAPSRSVVLVGARGTSVGWIWTIDDVAPSCIHELEMAIVDALGGPGDRIDEFVARFRRGRFDSRPR